MSADMAGLVIFFIGLTLLVSGAWFGLGAWAGIMLLGFGLMWLATIPTKPQPPDRNSSK